MDLNNKVALITGGASGIGRAIAENFVKAGVKVVVADMNPSTGAETVAALNKLSASSAAFVSCNVCDAASMDAAVAFTRTTFGRFDIMVNNAGIGDRPFEYQTAFTQSWRRIVDVNLVGLIYGTQEMQTTGGAIINIASMGGFLPMIDSPVYAATKAAVIHFSRSLGDLYNTHGIRVCAVCPTFTDTALVRGFGEQAVEVLKQRAGGEILKPEVVAEGIRMMLEDETQGGGSVLRVTYLRGFEYWTPTKVTKLGAKL